MSATFLNLNANLKKEADALLHEKGLYSILSAYGEPHISGSYTLDLMTWRDLDIYLEVDKLSETEFFDLGGKLCAALGPIKMSFRNELTAKTKGLPAGFYWGIYLGNERAGAWKIDIWAVEPTECQRLLSYCSAIQQKLTPEFVSYILKIKSECWQSPEYRRSYSSMDIYKAVLEQHVTTLDEFFACLKS